MGPGGVESARMKKNIFFEREFFEEKFLQPQFFFHPPILNTKNEIYIEVWHFLVRPMANGKLPKTRLDSKGGGVESRRKSPAHLGLNHLSGHSELFKVHLGTMTLSWPTHLD